jgi:hypothetical protein
MKNGFLRSFMSDIWKSGAKKRLSREGKSVTLRERLTIETRADVVKPEAKLG